MLEFSKPSAVRYPIECPTNIKHRDISLDSPVKCSHEVMGGDEHLGGTRVTRSKPMLENRRDGQVVKVFLHVATYDVLYVASH